MEEAVWPRQRENQWIDMARSGDLSAFNQLVLAYQDTAFRVAKSMVGDDLCAEDIVQSVFLAAYRQFDRLRGNHFRAWLLKMTRNACIDELCRRKRHPSLALESPDTDGEVGNLSAHVIDGGLTPEEALIQHETWNWIEDCLQRLPGSMREVVILIDIECFDYAETAQILGIPLGTVKSRLGRARVRLRDLMRWVVCN